MTKYKVLQYWQWGNLKLDKGQIILIKDNNDGNSLVSVEHYPEKNQVVSTRAVETMASLQKIIKY